MDPQLSILIVNWNTKALLLDCLRSLQTAAIAVPHEILVVDNASADGSADAVAELFPDVSLIRNAENVGFAAANNQAYQASRGGYVFLLNSDTLVGPGQIEPLVAFLDEHPKVGIVGPKLLNADGSFQLSATPFVEPWDVFYEFVRFPRLIQPRAQKAPRRLYTFDPVVPRPVDMVLGAALLIRRAVVEQIGPMDDQYFMYGEEQDWCFRTRQAGWEVYFFPTSAITHLGGQSTARVPHRMLAHRFVSTFRFLGKHHGPGAVRLTRLLLAWAAVQNNLLLAFRRLIGREDPASFTHAWQSNAVAFRTAWLGHVPAGLS